MPPPPTTPGPPADGLAVLQETARHVALPSGIVATGWPAVRDKAKTFGVTFDPWQDGAGRVILAKRADGSYACSIGGAVLSIPRQVGKTFLIGAIVFALCLLNPGVTVLWTAHRSRTAGETFSKMQAFARRKKVKPHVLKIVKGSGDEAVLFHNGSRILFGARERGFGRGFDDVDVIVFDEAQILTEAAIDDMVPAANAAANPLLFFVGTPPTPSNPSEVFTGKRAAALAGDEDTAYIEYSADRGADPNDRAQWRKANPSYPDRTSTASMLRLKKNLTPESFLREALGIWDEDDGSVVDMERWAELVGAGDLRPSPVALGIEMSRDRQWTVVGLAGARPPDDDRPNGGRHLQVLDSKRGSDWVVDRVLELRDRWGPVSIAVFAGGPAGSLIPDLEAAGVEVTTITEREMARGCGMLVDGVAQRTISHGGSMLLTTALRLARQKYHGAIWRWTGPEGVDVSPLEAATVALYALATAPEEQDFIVW